MKYVLKFKRLILYSCNIYFLNICLGVKKACIVNDSILKGKYRMKFQLKVPIFILYHDYTYIFCNFLSTN